MKLILFKIFLAIQACAIIFLPACGGSDANDKNIKASEEQHEANGGGDDASAKTTTEAKMIPDLPDVSFGGYEFTWLTHMTDDGNWVMGKPRDLVAEEETGDAINDATYKRNSVIGEKYGVEFKMVPVGDEVGILNKSVKAGDDIYDAVLIYNHNVSSVMSNDLLLDTSQLPRIDFGKPWWDSAVKEIAILGKNFFLAGDIIILDKESINVLFFNKNIMGNLGMTFPYQSVLDGKWTFDAFDEYIKNGAKDLNGDGELKWKDDQFGLVTFNDLMHALFVGGGGLLAKNDSSGIPRLSFGSAESIDILEKIADIAFKKDYITNYHVNGSTSLNADIAQAFVDDRALFMWGRLFILDSFRNMNSDFGILPLPKYNESQDRYYSDVNSYTGAMVCVPKSASDPERTSVALEALAAESRYTLLPAYYDITLQRKFARDEESEKMLDIIFGTTVYDIGGAYNFSGIWDTMSGLIGKGDRNFASFIEKNEAKAQKAIDKLVDHVESLN